jgi:hypothetical protein
MRKDVLLPYVDPNITSASMASNIIGTSIPIQYLDNVGVQLVWSGSNPIGSIVIQVSLDNSTWISIPATSVSPGGTPGNAYIDLNQLSAPHVRVAYTTAGGSVGNLTATIGAKMI